MLRRFSELLYQVSSGWVALAALAIFLLFIVFVLPDQAGNAEAQTDNAGTPDLSLIYSADNLYRWAEAYGEAGRREYIRARFTFDLIWPIVYTLFLTTAISWLYKRALEPGNPWRVANLAPLAAMLFDLLENISTSLVMFRYPAKTPVLDLLAPACTLVKWILVGGSFALLLAGIVLAAWRWVRAR